MPDKNGVRYIRTYRKPVAGPNPEDFREGGFWYSRVYPDGSSDRIWWGDGLATYNPEGRKLPRWVQKHLDANDWDGGNQ